MDEQRVHFNPDDREYLRQDGRRRGLVGLVIRLSGGRIQNEHVANYWLLGFAIVIFVISLVIFFV